MNLKKYYSLTVFIIVVIFFQTAATFSGNEFYLTQLTMSAYYSLVVIGLTVLMGYTGQISIGHAGFFAMGGYISAVLTTADLVKNGETWFGNLIIKAGLAVSQTDIYGTGHTYLSPWLSLIIAVTVTGIIASIIGVPILKLKGHYLAMATLGFGTIIYRIVLGTSLFGEADGISDVPSFALFGGLKISGDAASRVSNYYIAWGIVAFVMILLLNLIDSRAGRGLRSIHGSPEAAEAMGVNTSGYKIKIFVISAVLASAGGVLLTHFNGGIGPSEAGVMKSVRYVAIVAVGGMANLWGALIMGTILNFISLRGYLGTYDDAFFGLILIIFIMFFPEGIFRRENLRIIIKKIKRIIKR